MKADKLSEEVQHCILKLEDWPQPVKRLKNYMSTRQATTNEGAPEVLWHRTGWQLIEKELH